MFFPSFNFFTWYYYYSGACIVLCLTFFFVLVSLLSLFFSPEARNLASLLFPLELFFYVSVPSIRSLFTHHLPLRGGGTGERVYSPNFRCSIFWPC